ncbi:PREDICTED: high affinity immunoglobulin epsilon receptor subunit alpha [Ceratotherium simum simum]|uniref:high affinity immunoglobulin epsilon receptor subunit alpha n=1 Tax=Ceratotherium simum simum TaxID=73337 RepID=UPI0002C684A2|nr:PREDICTED: high affinity immunoglobulin epsilon receptor subunit alpha [Ceratotherium simum simum]
MSAPMGGPALLWITFLLFSLDGMSAGTRKSTVSLNPPWNRILLGESVTLICNKDEPVEGNSTEWIYNNTTLNVTTMSLDIVNAKSQNTGEYRCRNKKFSLSEPVYLEVSSDWLLLQASAQLLIEGKSLLIKCHSWKNWEVYKVIYYKDGKPLKYWYENHNISIANVTTEDSGSYYCEGAFYRKPGSIRYTSDPFNITVKRDPQSKYYRLQFLLPLLVAILFVVDTGLFISTQQQLTFLLKVKKTRKGRKLMDPHPKPDPRKN